MGFIVLHVWVTQFTAHGQGLAHYRVWQTRRITRAQILNPADSQHRGAGTTYSDGGVGGQSVGGRRQPCEVLPKTADNCVPPPGLRTAVKGSRKSVIGT